MSVTVKTKGVQYVGSLTNRDKKQKPVSYLHVMLLFFYCIMKSIMTSLIDYL